MPISKAPIAQQQRQYVKGVFSAGANPARSTNFMNKIQTQMLNDKIQKVVDQVDVLLKETTDLKQRYWLYGIHETLSYSLYLSVSLMKDSVE